MKLLLFACLVVSAYGKKGFHETFVLKTPFAFSGAVVNTSPKHSSSAWDGLIARSPRANVAGVACDACIISHTDIRGLMEKNKEMRAYFKNVLESLCIYLSRDWQKEVR